MLVAWPSGCQPLLLTAFPEALGLPFALGWRPRPRVCGSAQVGEKKKKKSRLRAKITLEPALPSAGNPSSWPPRTGEERT